MSKLKIWENFSSSQNLNENEIVNILTIINDLTIVKIRKDQSNLNLRNSLTFAYPTIMSKLVKLTGESV